MEFSNDNFLSVCSILQSIPKITALSPEATAVPLICVLAATGVKDAADDIVSQLTLDEADINKLT